MEYKKIGELFSYVSRGKSPKYVDNSDICIINQACIRWDGIDYTKVKYQDASNYREDTCLHDGDIVLTSTGTGTLGRCCVFHQPDQRVYVADSHVTVLRGAVGILPDILCLYLRTQRGQNKLYAECVNGSTNQIELSKEKLRLFVIPVPTMTTQRALVSQTTHINKIIELRKTELFELDALVKARFVEMFGDPVANSKMLPVHQLSEYIEFLTSGSRGWSQYFTDAGEYFITIKNVKDCRITLDNVQHVVPPRNAEAVRTRVQAGDLLISITADLGRTGVVTEEIADHGAYINQHLTCIRLNKEKLHPLYVAYYMESEAGKEQFNAKNQSAVKAGLNFNSINSLRLMVPPKCDQEAFVAFVEQTDKSKFSCENGGKEKSFAVKYIWESLCRGTRT